MASLLQNPDDNNTDVASGSGSTTTPTSGASPSTSATPKAPAGSGNQNDIQAITAANQGVDFSPLLNTVQGQGTAARNALTGATNTFNTNLGTFNPFGTSDQATLTSVLNNQSPLATGQALLNQKYTGPTSANNNLYDPLINTYATSAGETQNPAGISTLLGSTMPGLTPGERNYDALVFGASPSYQTQSRGLVNDANALQTMGTNQTGAETTGISGRQAAIPAFNQAASGFVQSQADSINSALNNQMAAANTSDNALQNYIPQLASGAINFNSLPTSDFGFDPNQYGPTDYKSLVGGPFDQLVDPRQYLAYQQGQLPTRGNVATPQQVMQYNNAQNLLQGFDSLTGAPRTAAQLNLNQSALQKALQDAQAARDAADNAWLLAHQPPPVQQVQAPGAPPMLNNGNDIGHGSEVAGGGGGQGMDMSAGDQNADTGGPDTSSGTADGPDTGGNSSQDGPDTGGNSSAESDSSDADAGFAKGGLVKSSLKAPRVYPIPPSTSPTQMPPAQQTQALPNTSNIPVQAMMAMGGYIPPTAGPPGRDTVPVRVNNGEFVTKTPAVRDIGVSNMAALNAIDSRSPAKQASVRNALHAALSKAAR